MDKREATVRRGEALLAGPNACPICSGSGSYECAHCGSYEGLHGYGREADCKACDGDGFHICTRCKTTGKVLPFEQLYAEDSGMRDVSLNGYRLQIWDTGQHHGKGPQQAIAYRLTTPEGHVLFEAADYGCSPLNSIDGDECLRGIIGFLTLQDGDTDEDYFYAYTKDQWEFANGDAEELSLFALEQEGDEPEPEHLPECKWDGVTRECADDCPLDTSLPSGSHFPDWSGYRCEACGFWNRGPGTCGGCARGAPK